MNRKMTTIAYMSITVVILSICAILGNIKEKTEGSIAMLSVGQGDSFLITAPNGAQMLIDGGKDAVVLSELARILPEHDRFIDVIVATHPDADHIGGLHSVLSRYAVGVIISSSVSSDTTVYTSLRADAEKRGIPWYVAKYPMHITLDTHTIFHVLFPDRDVRYWETNTASVVGRLDMYGSSALFTGDSPISIEQYLIETAPKDIDVDLLKLGHHGSKTSSSTSFLQATSPSLALISAGVSNTYGHPHKEVIDRLREMRIPWISTQQQGTQIFIPKGDSWVPRSF